MKTPIEIAAEIISEMPTDVLSVQMLKEVVVDFLKDRVMPVEQEHLTLAFMEGQSTPKASFEMWFNKKYKKTERTSDDSE
jgi:hypothetical protein